MGQNKTAIRQNVLDGDNLPNAILNAVIAGFDTATIVNDTVEVLQQGETSTFMFEATPDAIEQFADAFVIKVRSIATELRDFEYIDKPVIRRRDGVIVNPNEEVGEPSEDAKELGGSQETGIVDGADDVGEGIEVESAEEALLDTETETTDVGDSGSGFGDQSGLEAEFGGEKTVQKVAVEDIKIDAILSTQKSIDNGRFTGMVALKFPNRLSDLGTVVSAVINAMGIDPDELSDAVSDYTLGFVGRNADKYFGGMEPDVAIRTLEFTGMTFSESNERAIVSTFEVGG